VLTYRDMIDAIADGVGGNAQSGATRLVRTAIQDAYRDLAQATSDWKYLIREYRINLNASYSTGTIEYDYTGGANERQLTLTTGTWPSWAERGRVRIADVIYEVDRRISDSILTLDDVNSPVADIASGTSYELYQDLYQLPEDFLSSDQLMPASNRCGMQYVSAEEFAYRTRYSSSSGTPYIWTVFGSTERIVRLTLAIHPSPTTAETLDFTYRRRPQPLYYSGHDVFDSQGTIATTASSTTVTGTGTAFESGMAGSILRVSRNTQLPTDREGGNPFREELQIRSVTNATTLVLEAAAVNTASNVRYTISDPIDFTPVMLTAFRRLCEMHLEIARNGKFVAQKQQMYYMALREAKAADTPSRQQQYMGSGGPWPQRLADMPVEWES
jgi:hypothetical protein